MAKPEEGSVLGTQLNLPRTLKQRSLLWGVLCASCLALASLLAITFWSARYELQGMWYCYELRNAASSQAARNCIEHLWAEPGARTKLQVAVSHMGRGYPVLDFSMLLACRWPYRRLPSELTFAFYPEYEPEDSTQTICLELLVAEIGRRPELARLFCHWKRHKLFLEDWREDDEPRMLHDLPFKGQKIDSDSAPYYALDFASVCWCTGRDDWLHGLTMTNWRNRADEWYDWVYEDLGFLRFDSQERRWKLDEVAKKTEDYSYQSPSDIPAADKPLPDWTPPPGW